MHVSRTSLLVAGIVLGSCGPADHSITRGADGENDWSRRLAAAVPLGTRADSARSTMERNGFACSVMAGSVADLQCDKTSARNGVVQRRWRALLSMNRGQVIAVRAVTALDAP
jgi:hypothetical protein